MGTSSEVCSQILNMEIELQTKLFKLRNILNTISDTSYAYKTIYNKYRLDTLDDEQGAKVLKAYEDLIEQVKNSIQNYETPEIQSK